MGAVVFGGGVRRLADGSHAGAHKDKAWSGRVPEQRQKGLGHANGPDDVDRRDFTHSIPWDGVLAEDAGIVDQDIKTSVGSLDVRSSSVHGGVVRYIDLDRGDGAFDGETLEGGNGSGAFGEVSAA